LESGLARQNHRNNDLSQNKNFGGKDDKITHFPPKIAENSLNTEIIHSEK
jgi:hypothetical protein